MKRIAAQAVVVLVAVAGSAHASGMPQLAFGNPLLTAQVVWGAIIFALFYIGVSRYGLPQVDAILEHRAGVIGTDLEQARQAKLRADQAVAELNAARSRAYAERSGGGERGHVCGPRKARWTRRSRPAPGWTGNWRTARRRSARRAAGRWHRCTTLPPARRRRWWIG